MAEGCLNHEPEVLHAFANDEFSGRSCTWGFQIVVLRRETPLSPIAESTLSDVPPSYLHVDEEIWVMASVTLVADSILARNNLSGRNF